MSEKLYDTIIVGGGAAGLTAAIYAQRAGLDYVMLDVAASMGSQLTQTDEVENYTDPELIHDRFGSRVDVVVDGGIADAEPSTVIDCSDGSELLRQGKGVVDL